MDVLIESFDYETKLLEKENIAYATDMPLDISHSLFYFFANKLESIKATDRNDTRDV
ncbi:hypothetical protein PTRA_a2696 [Pseudoalteromonas translucida KMM 520]|uniref:Uncharacterized protein n=1 Tax=Pseudoalteromonas translucida KMM 520 TaxID=1315283 RepID=A0A0U2VGU8_9GAMM|nr:hypothetical protein [Pseudoalteromonas translucida]ALS33760.1 hypothetical protein PTRA_a2696 [Pseudoalteromonas translucida KMM 520]